MKRIFILIALLVTLPKCMVADEGGVTSQRNDAAATDPDLPAATPTPDSATPEDSDSNASDSNASDSNASVWMEKKLKHSEAVLRALAMGDFEQVQYNARRLKLLNRVEGFVRRKDPEYRAHLNTFSRVAAEIERQAERENIEGATLAFNQLTVSCVQCHKALRRGLQDAANAGQADEAKAD